MTTKICLDSLNSRDELRIRLIQVLMVCTFSLLVLDRPPSQMSFLEQFLKESSFVARGGGGSIESEEGDVEDNSSKSNLSELSGDRERDHHQMQMQQQHHPGLASMPPMTSASLSSNKLPKSHHQFLVRTFSSPLKCAHCTSLM